MFAIILNRYDGEMMESMKMDRRRLEHAHFCYAMLNVAGWYKGFAVKNVLFTSDQATFYVYTCCTTFTKPKSI